MFNFIFFALPVFAIIIIKLVFRYTSNEMTKSIDVYDPESKPDKSRHNVARISMIIYLLLNIPLVIFVGLSDFSLLSFYFVIALIPFLWLPVVLTGFNIINLHRNTYKAIGTDLSTIFIGGFYHLMLIYVNDNFTGKDYTEAIYPDEYHAVMHSEYSIIIQCVMVIGFISMILLCIRKPEKTPPLQSALCIAFTAIMLLLMGLIYIQMICKFEISFVMFYLYYFNLIIISARRIHYHITEQVRLANERETVFRTKFAEKLHKMMSTVSGMTKFSFMMILPIAIICEILYILFGQGADGFIKAFTMTADWTFSTQIPPPPMEYQGHYLCTVACSGHKKVVKPIRYGIRLNKKIVVNRQLLIANAFEDLIKECFPRSHRKIRNFYDKYGYPVSRHITTPTRADIIYIIMKPLEWLFLAVLYVFDTQPENRIAIQYSGYKVKR